MNVILKANKVKTVLNIRVNRQYLNKGTTCPNIPEKLRNDLAPFDDHDKVCHLTNLLWA